MNLRIDVAPRQGYLHCHLLIESRKRGVRLYDHFSRLNGAIKSTERLELLAAIKCFAYPRSSQYQMRCSRSPKLEGADLA